MKPDRVIALLLVAALGPALASGPTLYSQPAYESPVRAGPDELLLLPGAGLAASDRVIFQRSDDFSAPVGSAEIVSTADVPNSLTIRLPQEFSADSAYTLWVVNAQDERSNPVHVNDARPLWITPDHTYTTGSIANLPRVLKVVGRNLQPAAGAATRVRLTGPRTYTLTASPVARALGRYVAQVDLPASMAAGEYTIEVSRDGAAWVGLLATGIARPQKLLVEANPRPVPIVSVRDYTCEKGDDTSCIVNAINAAADSHRFPDGATVEFESREYVLDAPGEWRAGRSDSTKQVSFEGIWVPKHVNLQGRGIGKTLIERGRGWVSTQRRGPRGQPLPLTSMFNLQGNNIVQGFTFSDANTYDADSVLDVAAINLGISAVYARNIGLPPLPLSDIVISRNEFKLPLQGILARGLRLEHLFITYNILAAYKNGIYLNRWFNADPERAFDLTDSVIAHNTFYPSSHDAVIGSQIGGGTRLDFSDNVADGTATRYLYHATDRKGFRAGFFWNLSSNSEMKLISGNRIACSADKPGDGEAIVLDNADMKDYGGFERVAPVVSASAATVVAGAVPVPGRLPFVGQWLQIVGGPGLGQLRKITAYRADSNSATFTVDPAFDVPPTSASRVTLGLENWHSYIVSNSVDLGSKTCVNGAKQERTAGGILFYAQTADSVIEGNTQTATTGIVLTHQYILAAGKPMGLMLQSSNQVRDNDVMGRPAFGPVTGTSGIRAFYVASRQPEATPEPPVLGFATVIAGNRLDGADDPNGAIGLEDGGLVGFLNSDGGCTARYRLGVVPLIFHNQLRNTHGIDINGRNVRQNSSSCSDRLRDSIVWGAQLYNNSCNLAGRAVMDFGTGSQLKCAQAGNSCECASAAQQ